MYEELTVQEAVQDTNWSGLKGGVGDNLVRGKGKAEGSYVGRIHSSSGAGHK